MTSDPNELDEALSEQGEASPSDATPADGSAEETVAFVPDEAAGDQGPSAEDQLAAAEDRVLRLQAELQNVMNRSRRELADAYKYGPLDLARDLLPAIDNIDRALEAAAKSGETEGLAAGFTMVRNQLVEALGRQGCEPIATDQGIEFDPAFHEAILQQPSEEVPAGAILMAAQTGYKLHDRVVRAAQVIVSSGPAEG